MTRLSIAARTARAAYAKAWRKKNPQRAALHQRRYWEKVAKKQEEAKNGDAGWSPDAGGEPVAPNKKERGRENDNNLRAS